MRLTGSDKSFARNHINPLVCHSVVHLSSANTTKLLVSLCISVMKIIKEVVCGLISLKTSGRTKASHLHTPV